MKCPCKAVGFMSASVNRWRCSALACMPGLPWPLGRVLTVENGVVHELATSVSEAASPGARGR